MDKWLSDEVLGALDMRLASQGFPEFTDHRQACKQAKEANRLRRGLEHVILDIEGTPFLRATEVLPFLRELLED